MEATSPLVSLNGRNGPKDLGEYRKRAIENAARHQFYQSDRVKQFHRGLLLMETLNDRRLQMEQNRRIKDNNEEMRKLMAEIRRGELEALEQERQRASRREMDARANGDVIRQQMTEMAQARQQMKQDKQRELRESQALREQYERDELELLRLQRERKMGVRSAYLAQMAQSRGRRDEENRSEALAEERRQRCVREKDEWNRANEQKTADRLRRRQRRSQAAADALAARERERTRALEAAEASAHARALASQEARARREQSRREQTRLDVARGISAQREHKRREGQLRAEEERRSSLHLLSFNKEADRAHWEAEKRAARAQRDARVAMDAALRQQVADKRLQEELRKQAEMDADARKLELLEREDVQFQRYAAAVTQAAQACKRNTVPIRKAANAGARQGVSPISRGLRAKYLVPGSNYIPDYANSMTKDIKRLFNTTADESSHGKLGFIW